MDKKQMISELEAILFAAGDPVPAVRIARILGVDAETVLGLSRELGE